jgi:hypothetical protein
MSWFNFSDVKPPQDTPVWFFDATSGRIWVGQYDYVEDEGWAITNCYSSHHYDDGKWKSFDSEWDDQYEATHWMLLPEPPND